LTGTTSPRPVGVVTIGQTPRDDLTPELALHLPGVQLVERGALDGLTADEIASLAPGPEEVPVITRLAGGGSVTVSHGRITSLLRRALEDLVADGVPSTILACTGEFPEIDVPGVLRPGTLMRRALAGYAECGYRVGVVCPLVEQIEVVERSWYDVGIPVQVAAADPYAAVAANLAAAAARVVDDGATLVVLDCIGYTERDRRIAREASGAPVILARSLTAKLAAELVGSTPSAGTARPVGLDYSISPRRADGWDHR
jgi:protein AroM